MTFDFREAGYAGMFPYSAQIAGYIGLFQLDVTDPIIPTPLAPTTFVGGIKGNAIKQRQRPSNDEEDEEVALVMLMMGVSYGS